MKKLLLTLTLCAFIASPSPVRANAQSWDYKKIAWTAGGLVVGSLVYYLYKLYTKKTESVVTSPSRHALPAPVRPIITVPSALDEIPHDRPENIVGFNNFDTISSLTEMMSQFDEYASIFNKTAISETRFTRVLQDYARVAAGQLRNQSDWIDNEAFSKEFFDLNTRVPSTPYAQKLIIPTDSDVIMFGDLHGCAHSLLRNLERLKQDGYLDDNLTIKKPNTYMLFLGDFVDRGMYGVEVIYALMKLKLANPNHVFLVRGNHEDKGLNEAYGFTQELASKFANKNRLYEMVYRMYDLLPVVLYLGFEHNGAHNYFQCCHGGMEMGFNPQDLLKKPEKLFQIIKNVEQNRHAYAKTLCEDNIMQGTGVQHGLKHRGFDPAVIGFLWSDFVVNDDYRIIDCFPGRGLMYGKELTKSILKSASSAGHEIIGVIRAHQSYGEMFSGWYDGEQFFPGLCACGLVGLWDNAHNDRANLVYTTFSAPIYPGFDLDSYAILFVTKQGEWAIVSQAREIVKPPRAY